jgi:hypothetical protein
MEPVEWSEGTSKLFRYIEEHLPEHYDLMSKVLGEPIFKQTAERPQGFPIAADLETYSRDRQLHLALQVVTRREDPELVRFSMLNPLDRNLRPRKPRWITSEAYAWSIHTALFDSTETRFDRLVREASAKAIREQKLESVQRELENILIEDMNPGSDGKFLWDGIGNMIRSHTEHSPLDSFIGTLNDVAWSSVVSVLVAWLTLSVGKDKGNALLLEPIVRFLPAAIPLCTIKNDSRAVLVLAP